MGPGVRRDRQSLPEPPIKRSQGMDRAWSPGSPAAQRGFAPMPRVMSQQALCSEFRNSVCDSMQILVDMLKKVYIFLEMT